jgi:polysaccharide deacetylase 2 family uncharacterized protein YibQ
LALGTSTLTGSATLSSGGAITQTGAVTIAGTTGISAAGQDVTLDNSANDFGGAVSTTARNLTLRDTNALALGTSTLTGNATLTSGGAITQTGAVTIAGTTGISAAGQDVTLDNSANDFGGAVSTTARNLTLRDTNALALGTSTLTGNASLTSGGAITQTGAVTIAGTTGISAAGQDVTLDNSANDFGGAVSTTARNLTLRNVNALALGSSTLTGNATLTSGGAITQTSAVTIAGTTGISAAGQDVTLDNTANDFGGAVSTTARNLTLRDVNALALGSSTLTGNATLTSGGAITQTSAVTIAGTTGISAVGQDVTLDNSANDFGGAVSTSGRNISLRDLNALVLGVSTATGDGTFVSGGTLSQVGALVVSGTTTLVAGTPTGSAFASLEPIAATGSLSDLNLDDPGNDFRGFVNITGRVVALRAQNDMKVRSLNSGVDSDVTLRAGGLLSLPTTAIDTGLANLTLISGSTLTTAAPLSGKNIRLEGARGVTLQHDVTASADLTVTAVNSAIQQTTGKLLVGGRAVIAAGSGDVTLAGAANDFRGPVSVTGGNVTLQDRSELVMDSSQISKDANLQAESISQTGSISVAGSTSLLARTGNVVLANAANDFVGAVTATGNDVSLADTNSLTATIRSTNATVATRGPLQISLLNREGGDKDGVGSVSLSTAGNEVVFPQSTFTGQALRLSDISVIRTNPNEPARLLRVGAKTETIVVEPPGKSVIGVLRSISSSNPDLLFNGESWSSYQAGGLTSQSGYWWSSGSDDRDLIGPLKLTDDDGLALMLKVPGITVLAMRESDPVVSAAVRGVACTDDSDGDEDAERTLSGKCPR